MKALLQTARSVAPYLLVEILLPGGTLIALALWIMRNDGKVIPPQALLWTRRITGWIPSLSR